jgi:delta 1-pyrroline-5-carboxylate dehydrogenase
VEFPAGHLHRPDRRRAGGRQCRARQARRTDAADRRRGSAPVPQGRARARPAGLLPGRWRHGRCGWSRIRAIDGVAFTGGTDTASAINRALAARPAPIIPFIAETGGLNGMFVDTTALREQVVDDVILSAFGSAGQRCSALRILFVPQGQADEPDRDAQGALEALVIGDPTDPATDVGPVIDAEANAHRSEAHSRAAVEAEAKIIHRAPCPKAAKGDLSPRPSPNPDRRLPRARGVRPDPARLSL